MSKVQEIIKDTICEGCKSDSEDEHRCRADETFCVDGIGCPDYQEYCSCRSCWLALYE